MMMKTLWQDLRYSVRMLVKKPSFTLIAVMTLALGIGANTAIFTVINAVLLRSLPVPEPDRYVMVYETNQRRGHTQIPVAPSNYLAWRAQQTVFEEIAAFVNRSFTLTDGDVPEVLDGARVSAHLFKLFGTTPLLGRTFTADEDRPGNERILVLSHGLWQRRFNGSNKVVGQTMMIDGNPFTIIGVLPAEFSFPRNGTEFWIPAALDAERGMSGMGGRILQTVAKLKPDMTIEKARAEMDVIAKRLTQDNPSFNPDLGVNIIPLKEVIVGGLRRILLVLFGVVGVVLLIACANVANMLLARAAAREREMAIRTALGASRWRLIALLLLESLILATLGSGLGILLASWAVDALLAFGPEGVLGDWKIAIDRTVMGFTLALTLLTSLLFGFAPALQYSKPDLNEALKEGNRNATPGSAPNRLRGALVVAEVALSMVLLIGAGLLFRSFLRLTAVDSGFNPNHLLTFQLSLPEGRYVEDRQVVAFYQQLIERFTHLPGVESIGATNALPTSGSGGVRPLSIEGQPLPEPGKGAIAQYRLVSPGYFSAMKIPLLQGREFTVRDGDQAPGVVIINQALARKFFPNEDPVGKRVTLGGFADAWGEVVGVVGDVRHWGVTSEEEPEMYWAYSQSWLARSPTLGRLRRSLTVVIRTSGKPEELTQAVRREVTALDKMLPVSNLKTMEERMGASLSRQRFNALLISIFATLALLLAALGLYGVMSYSVSRRTNEIGIRMALGAQTGDVLKLVIREGMTLALVGIAIGLIVAFALTRLMSKLLFGVSATDPLTFVVIASILTMAALLACWLPARRAAKVDPMAALRYE
jgi:putative ABC transport system permease protein